MIMKIVEAYMTVDGALFSKHKEAIAYESNILRAEDVKQFVEKHCFSGMYSYDVSEILLDNFDELIAIVNRHIKRSAHGEF